jgi:hypothetical protein
MPAATVARAPVAPTPSAATKAAYPVSSEIVTLSCVSGVRLRISATIQPTVVPIAIPPTAPRTNYSPASASEKLPATTAVTATR